MFPLASYDTSNVRDIFLIASAVFSCLSPSSLVALVIPLSKFSSAVHCVLEVVAPAALGSALASAWDFFPFSMLSANARRENHLESVCAHRKKLFGLLIMLFSIFLSKKFSNTKFSEY